MELSGRRSEDYHTTGRQVTVALHRASLASDRKGARQWRALRPAFLSSVNIGFHEFNLGVWARMLLARDLG